MKAQEPYRLIISGGGTGGHIFPAISIANKFKERHSDAEILFVGATGRMEMTRVPEAGYKIIGLWISGLQRKLTLSNLLFPFKLLSSYIKAGGIVKKFRPHAVIGTGGYASGPIMLAATKNKIPALIQEQNSYAGLTNKQLANKAQRICVAYPGMEKYFPKDKLVFTGNPIRQTILSTEGKREKALLHFGLNHNQRTLLVIGGSLGSRTINESILAGIDKIIESKMQVIWQTGKIYFDEMRERVREKDVKHIAIFSFVQDMDLAYAAADVVVSRSGALAVSELCIVKKPVILVPSPNVAEDHQTKNALALVKEDAALLVRDSEARENLVNESQKLIYDLHRCENLSKNISRLAKPNATEDIVNEIEKLITE
ncbi:MAG: undecaprenyldiphospho-muramoylpentapeptide beta-N-acetylglucosaminyltransferase [Bacteroidetes bacterium]|nr:undecaprenyldiphospho-muramoylpentapeptide beta-N-acetylglucosaminyltransferase [Bacteroidota bacterium]